MSYLNISQAAWSLVLSKDPRIKPRALSPDDGSQDAAVDGLSALYDSPSSLTTAAAAAAAISRHQQGTDSSSEAHNNGSSSTVCGSSSTVCIIGRLQHMMVGKPAAPAAPADQPLRGTPAKPAQQQQVVDAATAASAEEDEPGALPMNLRVGQPKNQTSAPVAWSPCSGEPPSRWLETAHVPLWQAQAAAAARQAAAANRHVLGKLEQRRAALLKELGSARDMDFKRLLQLVQTYSDGVQALLEAGQAAALHQQQEYVQQLTADAAAIVAGSIESALAAAHKAHQQQVSLLQQGESTKLQAARLSAAQQLEALLKLQQQTAQQQLQQETQQLNEGWSGRCWQAEAAAERQEALRAHADSECSKLRVELAAAKREAGSWRARWEADCIANEGVSSSGVAGLGAAAGSSAGGLDRASNSGMTAAAFEFGFGQRASEALSDTAAG
ncbi:hypothetical protein COO60DRAFT_641787 [Scenedesmus sp. NREL 46B-D3]|nr:hypothetical protein COO60DRAFT_641787 [Scenedesmus sp. NREL 46B-D3]